MAFITARKYQNKKVKSDLIPSAIDLFPTTFFPDDVLKKTLKVFPKAVNL